jgi:hypothetical protein
MTSKVTILATSLIVACAQVVEATPRASYPESPQRFAANGFALCLGPGGAERQLETGYALNALRWSAPVSMDPYPVLLPWGFEDHLLSFHLDYSSTAIVAKVSAPNVAGVSSIAYQQVAALLTTPGEIEAEITPLSGNEAAQALRRAWKRAMKQTPNLDALAILTAHWAHETAAGAAMFNNNFGGIKGRGTDGLSFIKGAREGFGVRTQVVRGRFRAYTSAASGADDYISLLLRKYALAMEAAGRGNTADFVAALHSGKYFTGSVQDYTRALCRRTIPAHDWALSALRGIRSTFPPSAPAAGAPSENVQLGTPLPQHDGCDDALR